MSLTAIAIFIDFDGTLTVCPEAWKAAIDVWRSNGHAVFAITQRPGNAENCHDVDGWLAEHGLTSLSVVYCDHASKVRKIQSMLPRLGKTRFVLCDDDPVTAVKGF